MLGKVRESNCISTAGLEKTWFTAEEVPSPITIYPYIIETLEKIQYDVDNDDEFKLVSFYCYYVFLKKLISYSGFGFQIGNLILEAILCLQKPKGEVFAGTERIL